MTDTIEMKNPNELYPSPFNYRKDLKLTPDFLASVEEKGIIEPVIARIVPSKKKPRLELVVGHRRAAAAKQLGKLVPTIIRPMDEQEAREVQLVENIQREDVPPIEEAEAFAQLLVQTKFRRGLDPSEIAARVGKSEGYVYRRIVLNKLSKACKESLAKGQLTLSVAELVARIPDEDLQDIALKRLINWDKSCVSVTAAHRVIEGKFMLRLQGCQFPRTDETLVPGAGSCEQCPKRTGNQPALFEDVKSGDVCTDPKCFRQKQDAHFKRLSEQKPDQVITDPKEIKKIFIHNADMPSYGSPYTSLDDTRYDHTTKKNRKLRSILGKNKPPVFLVQAPNGRTLELVRRKDVEKSPEVAKAEGKTPAQKAKESSSKVDLKEQAKKDRAEQKIRKRAVSIYIEQTVNGTNKANPPPLFWRGLALSTVTASWSENIKAVTDRREITPPKESYDRPDDVLRKLIRKADENVCRGIVIELLITCFANQSERFPEGLKILADAAGVDFKQCKTLARDEVKQRKLSQASKKKATKKKATKKKTSKKKATKK